MKKIISLIFVFIIVFSTFPLSVFASEEESSSNDVEVVPEDLSKTDIAYDFQYVFAGQYDVSAFTYDSNDTDLHFITALEGETLEGIKELYIYIYNPSRIVWHEYSEHNTISISVSSEGDDYSQYRLSFVNDYSSTNDEVLYTNGLILKYRVNDVSLSGNVRRYKLGEFELLKKGESLPEYSMAAMQYEFSANSLGYVNCIATDLSVIQTEAFHTFYRVKASGESTDIYNDIRAVYFPVSNNYLEAYGGMAYLEASWKEYSTSNILVTDNQGIVNAFQSELGTSLKDSKYSVLFNQSKLTFGGLARPNLNCRYYRSAYNVEALSDWVSFDYGGFYDDDNLLASYKFSRDYFLSNVQAPTFSTHEGYPITNVVHAENVIDLMSLLVYGEDLLDYYESKVSWGYPFLSFVNEESEKRFYFETDVEIAGGGTRCSFFEALKNDGVYYNTLSDDEKKTFSNFVEIDTNEVKYILTPEQISEKYYVDLDDVADFISNISNDEYEDCSWFMLRYEVTDYKASGAVVLDNESGEVIGNSCIASMSLIFDFDFIEVAFGDPKDASTYCVFPIGMSPTSAMTDIWSPSIPLLDVPDEESLIYKIWKMIEKILAVLTVVLVVALIVYLVLMYYSNRVTVKIKKE